MADDYNRVPGGEPQPVPTATVDSFEFNHPTIVSLLYLAGFVTGLTAIVGLVLAYVWRGEAHAAWETSHYSFHIRTFWYGLLFSMIGAFLMIILIGWLVWLATVAWFLVRTIKAMLAAQKRQPLPDPTTWMW